MTVCRKKDKGIQKTGEGQGAKTQNAVGETGMWLGMLG